MCRKLGRMDKSQPPLGCLFRGLLSDTDDLQELKDWTGKSGGLGCMF